ncbi:MAG: chromate transporter [Spirochaetaceae bacterium]|jgi:chromate transporter|nr:chromate transporter [Spirochaetaceae bacterium]
MAEWIDLIWTFIKIGASTFGGGYAMVPVLERELIRGKGWITMDEVMDYYTIAQVTPGIIAVNISTFVGWKRKGWRGGILATAGFILPGVILMTAVSLFISRFAEYPAVQHAFAGIRIAVGALILDTIRKLVKGFYRNAPSTAVFIIAFGVSVLAGVSPVYVIIAAGLLGWLLYRFRRKPGLPAKAPEQAEGSGKDDSEK